MERWYCPPFDTVNNLDTVESRHMWTPSTCSLHEVGQLLYDIKLCQQTFAEMYPSGCVAGRLKSRPSAGKYRNPILQPALIYYSVDTQYTVVGMCE